MKAATLRRFMAVHSTVGMVTGLLLFIAFFAGALTLFHHEIEAWAVAGDAVPSASAASQAGDTATRAQRLLDGVLARAPQLARDLRLSLSHEGKDALLVQAQDPQTRQWQRYGLDEQGQVQLLAERTDLSDFIYRLHYTAGVPTPWGTYLLGVVSLLYGLALVSGVLIYLPVLTRDLFALRWGRNLKRLWQDTHNALGLLSLPFHVVFAWSGAVLGIGTLLLAPFQYLVYEGRLLEIMGPQAGFSAPVVAQGRPAPLLSVAQLVAAAEAAAPGMEVERLRLRQVGDAAAQVEVDGQVSQRLLSHYGRVTLDGVSGQRLARQLPQDYTLGTAMLRGLQSLHFGDYAGWALRWVYFLLGLAGALLFYTGNLLWVESRRKHHQAQQPAQALWMARLTVGICLGCMLGVLALFPLVRLLGQAAAAPWLQPLYFAMLLASVLWALWRPLAVAAQQLCVALAALCGLLVLVDWAVLGALPLRQAWHGEWVLLSVQLLALLFAALMGWLAAAVRRRAQHGPAHSVWAQAA